MRQVQQISEARAKANHQNACKSTGPKTAAGKTVSRLNATTHGVLSALQVLPQVERQRDWEVHHKLMLANLKPVGYLETSLAERIALFFWRLGRVARYEREVSAIRQESLAEEIAESRREKAKVDRLCASSSPIPVFGISEDMQTEEVISRPGKDKKDLALLEGFPKLPDSAELTSAQAMTLVCAIESVGEVDIYNEDFPPFPGIPDNVTLDDFDRWTAGIVRGACKVIATTAGVEPRGSVFDGRHPSPRRACRCASRAQASDDATRSWPAPASTSGERGLGQDQSLREPSRTLPLPRPARAAASAGHARRPHLSADSSGPECYRQGFGLKQILRNEPTLASAASIWLHRKYLSAARRQRIEDEAAKQGKKPPPHDDPVSRAYREGLERWKKGFPGAG
jgi:hypothetical protein